MASKPDRVSLAIMESRGALRHYRYLRQTQGMARAAPARFPYDHRTCEQVWRDSHAPWAFGREAVDASVEIGEG